MQVTDGPQVGDAPAHPLLLRKRDYRGLHPPARPDLHLLQVHPTPAPAPVRCPPLHQQVVSEGRSVEEQEQTCQVVGIYS